MAAPEHILIFANGDINDGPLVRQALATAPDALVIAADGGTRLAKHFNRAVHTIIGDMDSVDPAELDALAAAGVEVRRFPREKDETDLELALLHAAHLSATWIRIIGGIGDRLDQTLSSIYLLALPELRGRDVRLVAGKQEALLLFPGEWIITGSSGDTLSLIPLGGTVGRIETENLYYPLRGERLAFGPARGISNVMQTDQARIRFDDGILLAVHTLGRA